MVVMVGVDEFGFDISKIKAYSGYYKDERKLRASASGGIATEIAEKFILHGGVVFGVIYSSDFRNAEYYCAQSVDELDKLKGSKYIRKLPAFRY